ncbi:hypothetical protein SAY86_010939 [Trapa natans]|uniref:Metallothionein-like protein type 3 n=1 Tax=Trapa natans TaxID=22666 RepID=A0AAN7LJA6_TRANT|nr:hypothetical protein SAY86_010939 [Trapa natans]
MADKCGNCDCTDKSQCVKKGSIYVIDVVETDKSFINAAVIDAVAYEHEGKCKCGSSCTCTGCTCGH